MVTYNAVTHTAGENLLAASGLSPFFEIDNFRELGCPVPEDAIQGRDPGHPLFRWQGIRISIHRID